MLVINISIYTIPSWSFNCWLVSDGVGDGDDGDECVDYRLSTLDCRPKATPQTTMYTVQYTQYTVSVAAAVAPGTILCVLLINSHHNNKYVSIPTNRRDDENALQRVTPN